MKKKMLEQLCEIQSGMTKEYRDMIINGVCELYLKYGWSTKIATIRFSECGLDNFQIIKLIKVLKRNKLYQKQKRMP